MNAMGLREKLKATAANRPAEFDPVQALARWQSWVDALYREIEKCLGYLKQDNLGTIVRTRTRKYEELLGEYDIDTLVVETPNLRVMFDPKGKHTIGANGRIDVVQIGNFDHSAMLLYFTEKQDEPGHWEIREARDTRMGVPFTCKALDDLLGKWIDAGR